FAEAHNATADVEATTRCFLELLRRELFRSEVLAVPADYYTRFSEANPQAIQLIGLKHINLKKASEEIRKRLQKESAPEKISAEENRDNLGMRHEVRFSHLHNHSQYSVLQSTLRVQDLVKAAVKNDLPAVALTDHDNMMGAFHFVKEVGAYNKGVKAKNEAAL